jgi:hypothetical protein
MTALNPFPGYPVATIAGRVDWTAPTEEVSQARKIVEGFVENWQAAAPGAQAKAPGEDVPLAGETTMTSSPGDRSAVVQISGDYGTGKTHVLLDIDNSLREGFAARKTRKVHILRVAGVEADPAGWYQNSIGPVLNDLGGPSPDGGWFARLALDIYVQAARQFLPKSKDLTDPGTAFQLVRNGILNASDVDRAYAELIDNAVQGTSKTVKSQLVALLDRHRRSQAEQWLCGNLAPATGSDSVVSPDFRDGDAIDVLAAAAALSLCVGAPFALLIDEIELFLGADDRTHAMTNAIWLKRLLSQMANAGAFVAVSGHRSAWDRRADFLQRFSVGRRIEMRRLVADDIVSIISLRVGTHLDLAFDNTQAEAIAEATRGNMRRVLSLCRVLFDQSNGFTTSLSPQAIKDKAAELSQAPKPDQVLLRVQELFEEQKLSIDKDLLRSRGLKFDFDLIARSGAKSYFVVMVRPTPNVKEAQDFVRQFLAQLATAKRRGERFSAFFICDTPADRDYVAKANEPSGVSFAWIDYTDARFINEVEQAVNRPLLTTQAADAGAISAEAVRDLDDSIWNQRLDEIDRRRTLELKDLRERLTQATQLAEAASKTAEKAVEARRSETATAAPILPPSVAEPVAPSPAQEPSAQPFSAAELFETPTLAFRLRLLLGSNLIGIVAAIAVGLVMILFASEFSRLTTGYATESEAYILTKQGFVVAGGMLVLSVMAYLLKRFFDIENYFDHASHLIKEYYLAAPHPRLLAGADRLCRELVLLNGPRRALGMLGPELARLLDERPLTLGSVNPYGASVGFFENTSSPVTSGTSGRDLR